MRYFFSANAARAIRSQGLSFLFEVVDCVGGTWHGVFSTDNETEIAALLPLVAANKIKEITAEEFASELEAKKKVRSSPPLAKSELPPNPQARINSAPAVLVEDPVSSGLGESPSNPAITSIDEVLKTAKVIPPEAPKQTVRKKKAA